MNALQFFRLLHTIYGRGKPDLALIQMLGLLAVKIGQVHALRPDFLNEEKCRELARLYRHTDHSHGMNADALLAASAPGLRAQLGRFDSTPLASASIGQVHRASLLSGEEVVVKLVKSDFRDSFESDVRRVARLFRIAVALYPPLRGVANPLSLLRLIERTTLSELDLRNEVAGQHTLQQIAEAYGDQFDLSDLGFIPIYESLSGENVMVSEYLPGPSLDELLEQGRLSYEMLLRLFHLHGFYMFIAGTFHGDFHPGNILVNEGRYYFIDTGYVGTVGDSIRRHLFDFFLSLSEYDYPACAHHLHLMSEMPLEPAAYSAFERKFLTLYADFRGKSVSEISLTQKMMATIRLGVLSGMRFGDGIFDIIKSLMYLDGMVLRAKPSAVLMEDIRPYLLEFKPLIK